MDINSVLETYLPILIYILPILLVLVVSRWIIYKKAGKKGWTNLIPIYSDIILLQIAKLPVWYIILYLIPIVNIFIIFKIHIELAHQFGKSTGFGIATVLFGIVCFPILAFSKKSIYSDNKNNFYQQNKNVVSQTPLPTTSSPLFAPPKIENNVNTVENIEKQKEEQIVNNNITQPVANQMVQNNEINRVELQQENTFKYEFSNSKDANQPEPEKPFDNFSKTNNEIKNTQLEQQPQNNNLFPQPKVTNLNNVNNQNNIN